MIQRGDKVVCVDDKWPDWVKHFPYYQHLPVKDTVYVVREVLPARDADARIMDMRKLPALALLLVGLVNPKSEVGHEHGFDVRRFRKLEELQEKQYASKELVEKH